MRSLGALVAASLLSMPLMGCETMGRAVVAMDRGLYEVVPLHPVTGRPVANLVSQEQEVRGAGQRHQQIVTAAARQGVALDMPGPRRDQMERVFKRLVAVAHRQQLPWQVHLVDHETVNAFTTGGGYVYV